MCDDNKLQRLFKKMSSFTSPATAQQTSLHKCLHKITDFKNKKVDEIVVKQWLVCGVGLPVIEC